MNKFPGTLVIFEGPDGSGKTTQIEMLAQSLRDQGKQVFVSSWKNAPFFSDFFRENDRSEVRDMVTPQANLFLQAADLLYRIDTYIIPALERGDTVLMDRSIQTLLVRGRMIGYTQDQLENGLCWFASHLYEDLFKQARVLYFQIDAETSLERIKQRELYGESEIGEGTLISQHLVRNLKYAPDGERLTALKRSQMMYSLQEQVVMLYDEMVNDDYRILPAHEDIEKIQESLRSAL